MSGPDPPARPFVPAGWTLPRLEITRDGEWRHEGVEVTHAGILAHLQESLRVDAEGHHLQIGSVRVPVVVEDAPYAVRRIEREGDALVLTLSDLSREPLDVATLTLGGDAIPRCRVKGGRFVARFDRAAAFQLLALAEYDEAEDRASLVVGARRVPIGA